MLLETKLFMPQSREGMIVRDTLIQHLDEISETGLATVCAPPGYGKTTLITQWLSNNKSNYCWVSLDSRDNDASIFWQYMTAALSRLDERFSNHLRSTQKQPLDTSDLTIKIDGLIAELITFSRTWNAPSQLILVLDDYHVISNPTIHSQLNHFINYTPDWIKFIVTSRREPELELPRRRVRQQVTELNSQQLRFNLEDSKRFLSSRLSLELTNDQLSMLHRRTEGWIAAIQLAGLSLKNHPAKDVFIQSFSGKESLLSSYLLSEVFELQSEYVQSFLLRLATVPRFCAELADLITGHKNCQQLIDTLRAQNLLIVPLDDENHWFRFHDLFREWLVNRQEKQTLKGLTETRTQAAQWFEKHNCILEALEQVIALEDWKWGSLLAGRLLLELARNGEFTLAKAIVDMFPRPFALSQPKLCFMQALDYFYQKRYPEALDLLKETESTLASIAPDKEADNLSSIGLQPNENPNDITAICMFLRNQINGSTGKMESNLKAISDLQLKISSSSDVYGWSLVGLGSEQFANNQMKAAEENLLKSIRVSQQKNDPFCLLSALAWLTPTLIQQGKLTSGLKLIEEISLWIAPFNAETLPNFIMLSYSRITIYIELNRLEEATSMYHESTEKWEGNTEPLNLLYWKFLGFQLHFSMNDLDSATKALDELESIFQENFNDWQLVIPCPKALRTLINLKQGDNAPLLKWADEFEKTPPNTNPFRLEEEKRIFAWSGLLQGKDISELIESIRSNAEHHQAIFRLTTCDLLQAYFLASQGQIGLAMDSFRRVLENCLEHGFIRLLVNEESVIKPLLNAAIQLEVESEYAQKILDLINENNTVVLPTPISTPATTLAANKHASPTHDAEQSPPLNHFQSGLDPLSSREIEVLKLIDEGNPNKTIAAKLNVAPTTIKSHIRNIYGKLGVHRRTQALALARANGLL